MARLTKLENEALDAAEELFLVVSGAIDGVQSDAWKANAVRAREQYLSLLARVSEQLAEDP